MIDTSKQYTYDGKPVRIYADGSDTVSKCVHGAFLGDKGWFLTAFKESELVEVWEPVAGEWCYFWDNNKEIKVGIFKLLCVDSVYPYQISTGSSWKHCAKFTGTLPEAFKGL